MNISCRGMRIPHLFIMIHIMCVYVIRHTLTFSTVPFFAARTTKKKYPIIHDRRYHNLCQTAKNESEDDELMPGNVLAQRSIYRLSPFRNKSSSLQIPYALEERQYYFISQDKTLEPLGKRSIILRGGDAHEEDYAVDSHWTWSIEDNGEESHDNVVEEKAKRPRVHTRIGPALYIIDDLIDEEGSSGGRLGGSVWDKYYVMALYCVQHPGIVSGTGLEIGSGVGIGAILSVIGAAAAYNRGMSNDDVFSSTEQSNDTESSALVPASFSKIILTDTDDDMIKACIDNLNAAAFPGEKAEVGNLDLNKPVNNGLRDRFNFIIAADCAYDLPAAGTIAKFVAYCLKKETNHNAQRGSFLHIGPKSRENVHDLIVRLTRGYRMDAEIEDVTLQRFDLAPVIANNIKDAQSQLRVEIEGMAGGYVEYERFDQSTYTAVRVCHNQDPKHVNQVYDYSADEISTTKRNSGEVHLERTVDHPISIPQYKSWQKFHRGSSMEFQPSASLFKNTFMDRNSVVYDRSWFERASPSIFGMAAIITAAFIGFRAAQIPSTTIILYETNGDVTQTKMLISPNTASFRLHPYPTMMMMNSAEDTEMTQIKTAKNRNELEVASKTDSKVSELINLQDSFDISKSVDTTTKANWQSIEMTQVKTDAEQINTDREDAIGEARREEVNELHDVESIVISESKVDAVSAVKDEEDDLLSKEDGCITSEEISTIETTVSINAEVEEINTVVEVAPENNADKTELNDQNMLAEHEHDVVKARETTDVNSVLIKNNAKEENRLDPTAILIEEGRYESIVEADEIGKKVAEETKTDALIYKTSERVETEMPADLLVSESNVMVKEMGGSMSDGTTSVKEGVSSLTRAPSRFHNEIRTLVGERSNVINEMKALKSHDLDKKSGIVLLSAAVSASAVMKHYSRDESKCVSPSTSFMTGVYGGVTGTYLDKIGSCDSKIKESHSKDTVDNSSQVEISRITSSSLSSTNTFSLPSKSKHIKQISSSRIHSSSLNESEGQYLGTISTATKTELRAMQALQETEQMSGQEVAPSASFLGEKHEEEGGLRSHVEVPIEYFTSETSGTSNAKQSFNKKTTPSSQNSKHVHNDRITTTTTITSTNTTTTTTTTTTSTLSSGSTHLYARVLTTKTSRDSQMRNIASQCVVNNESSDDAEFINTVEKHTAHNVEINAEKSVEYWCERYVEKMFEENL